MPSVPFNPIERQGRARIELLLAELAKDCDELAAESGRGKIEGVPHGLSKARDVVNALQSLNRLLKEQ
jgi:hypothetical protein